MDPLFLPGRELTAAWDAAHAVRRARDVSEITIAWASAISHLEKLWIKTGQACYERRKGFQNWNRPYEKLRAEDPLLVYVTKARDADHHTSGHLAAGVAGRLEFSGQGIRFVLFDRADPVLLEVTTRGVTYPVPTTHLGQPLNTRDPREIVVHACNFYADYLQRARVEFLGLAL